MSSPIRRDRSRSSRGSSKSRRRLAAGGRRRRLNAHSLARVHCRNEHEVSITVLAQCSTFRTRALGALWRLPLREAVGRVRPQSSWGWLKGSGRSSPRGSRQCQAGQGAHWGAELVPKVRVTKASCVGVDEGDHLSRSFAPLRDAGSMLASDTSPCCAVLRVCGALSKVDARQARPPPPLGGPSSFPPSLPGHPRRLPCLSRLMRQPASPRWANASALDHQPRRRARQLPALSASSTSGKRSAHLVAFDRNGEASAQRP